MVNQGLGLWVQRRRDRTPHQVAIIHDGATITYAQLADAVDACAAHLHSHGVVAGDRVAYIGENSPEFISTLLACASVGAIFVPVNTRLAVPEIAHVLADSGASVLIHDDRSSVPWSQAAKEAGVTRDLEARSAITSATDRSASPPAEVSLDQVAAIIYTSGTTGRAKGAALTHGNLTWVAMNCIIDYDVRADDVALMVSPLFHVASLGMGALPILLKGATLVLERGFDAGRALELIERHGVTMLSGVPTTFHMMAQHPAWADTDLSSLRKLTCGGSPAPLALIEEYEARGLRFSQGYGMTEASPGVTALAADRTHDKQGSVGQAHFFTHVRVAGEDGHPAPSGSIGEIEIAGPNVFGGYWSTPPGGDDAFTEDGWYRTGDLGYLDDDGFLFIAGRAKDMIISGGENIYPAEVESVLSTMESITGVAIVGHSDDRWGEVPWAVVTVTEGAEVTSEDIQAFLDGKVARYKIPKRVVTVDELPRTASGKVQKNLLRDMIADM